MLNNPLMGLINAIPVDMILNICKFDPDIHNMSAVVNNDLPGACASPITCLCFACNIFSFAATTIKSKQVSKRVSKRSRKLIYQLCHCCHPPPPRRPRVRKVAYGDCTTTRRAWKTLARFSSTAFTPSTTNTRYWKFLFSSWFRRE